jgi:hypothetical protein
MLLPLQARTPPASWASTLSASLTTSCRTSSRCRARATRLCRGRELLRGRRGLPVQLRMERTFTAAASPPPPCHLPRPPQPLLPQVALKQREFLSVYGGDYPTNDGTCIRRAAAYCCCPLPLSLHLLAARVGMLYRPHASWRPPTPSTPSSVTNHMAGLAPGCPSLAAPPQPDSSHPAPTPPLPEPHPPTPPPPHPALPRPPRPPAGTTST